MTPMRPTSTALALVFLRHVLAQSSQLLPLNSFVSFSPATVPNPPTFSLPSSTTLTVSVALCSDSSQSQNPRFFVTNSSSVGVPGSTNVGTQNIFEIVVQQGLGVWSGSFRSGGIVAVENVGQMSFELGVSDNAPIHESIPYLPLLGDTTSNQVLLLSAPFNSSPPAQSYFPQPTYPNYTLPSGNLSFPTPPSSSPNFTLVLAPTSLVPPLTELQQTGCRLSAVNSTGVVANETLWLRDIQGWRNQWLVNGLSPVTNYTAYVVQDKTKVSGPIYFITKSASFSCPLVHSLPYCPTVSFAVPLPPPPAPAPAYDSTLLPSSLTGPLVQYMSNFTTTLLSLACGRDLYSPLVTCAECQSAYRTWLCTVSFTRCSEPAPGSAISSSIPAPTATGIGALWQTLGSTDQQVPISALVPQPTSSTPRNPNLPNMTTEYTALLPCLEVCTAADRACPSALGFRCPHLRFNAAASYGVGYIDQGPGGVQGQGVTGVAQDQWGNVWCNGI